MERTYHFGRNDNFDPTGTQISSDVTTSIRGNDPSFEAVMSGIQSFVIACGFDIGDSGIAPVPPSE
jgi:hypothetical protein|tara:strand:+ start:1444 stop:1641 length:198 start_codon:yes stop_codon:yes gene_type:complete